MLNLAVSFQVPGGFQGPFGQSVIETSRMQSAASAYLYRYAADAERCSCVPDDDVVKSEVEGPIVAPPISDLQYLFPGP